MCEYPHVVVTGASSSAGRAVTLCLAASGYHVYAGVRTHAASSGPLRADGRARASARSVHKRCFLCYFLAHAC